MSGWKQLKNDLIFLAIKSLVFVMENLPRSAALRSAGMIGELVAIIDAKERKLAESNLRQAYGDQWNELKIKLVARECFTKIALNTADVIQSKKWSAVDLERLVDVEGMEHFDPAFEKGKGAIGLTGHIGNFELLGAWFASVKKICPAVIGRRIYDERLNRMVIENRERFGMKNIPSDTAAKRVFSHLRSGDLLGVLLDVDSSRLSSRFIPFFGVPARTAEGPILIARRTNTPIIPMAMFRTDDDRYRLRILPAFEADCTDNKDADMIKALTKCNQALEELINYDPTQWAWIHNRWKSKPEQKEANEQNREAVASIK
jgi:KDO2-lipid IV(A) lauroyltransferase